MNIPQGLEQGFTVTNAPAGSCKLVLQLTSQDKPEQNQGAFRWGNLQYGGLYAVDSTGKELATHFSVQGNTINIEVDDSHAIYPVTIDPLIEEVSLSASDGAVGKKFANSVAISDDGNTAVVGDELENNVFGSTRVGSAYIFVKNSGVWTEQRKLTVTGSSRFGVSVAISSDGNTLLVASFKDASDTGSAYVFTRSGATWTQQQKLLASDGAAGDLFGFSVDLSSDGNTAIVGAYAHDVSFTGSDEGAAYVFRRSGVVWTEQQILTDINGESTDFFGYSVALSGDSNTVIASALTADTVSNSAGAAFIFAWNGSTWLQQSKLVASDGGSADFFGESTSLSFDGNTALVGAPMADVGGNTDQGAAYVFINNSGIWSEDQQLTSSSTWTDANYFGNSVALSGDSTKAIICAPLDNNSRGNAYVFVADSPSITVEDSVAPIDDQQIPFGDVAEFSALDQTVTVRNDGTSDLTLGLIAQSDTLALPFSILNDTCSSQILTPSSSCTLTVRFEPQSTGAFSDSFDIPSDDPNNNPVTLSLTGTGIGMQVPNITVTDSVVPTSDLQIVFGNVTQAASSDETVTITNDGNADLTIGSIAAVDILVAPFNILNDACTGTTVAPTENCTLTVRFAPTAAGAFNDSFDIPSNDADENPITINLSGSGVAADTGDGSDDDDGIFGIGAFDPLILLAMFMLSVINLANRRWRS